MKVVNSFENEETMTLEKPTLEEYQKAKQDYKTYCSWLRMAREKKNELIDALAVERENELLYLKQVEKQHEIIRCYEIYEQLEKGSANNA
jgi:hypothetical protein